MNLEPAFYEGVGRVVVAAAALDFMLATMVRLLAPSPDDLWSIASAPGRAIRDLENLGKQLPPDGDMHIEVRAIAADARAVLNERNRVAHSLHFTVQGGDAAGPAAVHPRTEKQKQKRDRTPGQWDSPPTTDDLALLTSRITQIGGRAAEWLIRHAGVSDPREPGSRPTGAWPRADS